LIGFDLAPKHAGACAKIASCASLPPIEALPTAATALTN
jgi:hypothetical protein